VAHPTDSKLLETARSKVVEVAKANGIELKQTYAKEGQVLGYKAVRYAHARQFKRMRKVIKRQRTIFGRLQREVARKMTTLSQAVQETLGQTLDKAKRLVAQTASRKAVDNRAKLYKRLSASARQDAFQHGAFWQCAGVLGFGGAFVSSPDHGGWPHHVDG
jgi:IS5 family transposase